MMRMDLSGAFMLKAELVDAPGKLSRQRILKVFGPASNEEKRASEFLSVVLVLVPRVLMFRGMTATTRTRTSTKKALLVNPTLARNFRRVPNGMAHREHRFRIFGFRSRGGQVLCRALRYEPDEQTH